MSKQTEFVLLPPRLLPLPLEREQAAVRLLSELLLAEAGKNGGGVSDGASDSGSDGASGVVVPFPVRCVRARKAA